MHGPCSEVGCSEPWGRRGCSVRLRAFLDMLALRRHRVLAMCDAGAWLCASIVATVARRDFDLDRVDWMSTLAFAAMGISLFTFVAWVTRLHDGRARLGSLDEMVGLAIASFAIGSVLFVV